MGKVIAFRAERISLLECVRKKIRRRNMSPFCMIINLTYSAECYITSECDVFVEEFYVGWCGGSEKISVPNPCPLSLHTAYVQYRLRRCNAQYCWRVGDPCH
jgi:hypothetical protein